MRGLAEEIGTAREMTPEEINARAEHDRRWQIQNRVRATIEMIQEHGTIEDVARVAEALKPIALDVLSR